MSLFKWNRPKVAFILFIFPLLVLSQRWIKFNGWLRLFDCLLVVFRKHVWKLAAFERCNFIYLGLHQLLLSNFNCLCLFVVNLRSDCIFWDFIWGLMVRPEIDHPSNVVLICMGIFDKMSKLGDIGGHDGMGWFYFFVFFHDWNLNKNG